MSSIVKAPAGYFNKSIIARKILAERAEEILAKYLKVLDDAQKMGEYDVAAKGYQWLIDHMPADSDGTRLVNTSVDKAVDAPKQAPPSVQIGIQLGGVRPQKALPDITVETIDSE